MILTTLGHLVSLHHRLRFQWDWQPWRCFNDGEQIVSDISKLTLIEIPIDELHPPVSKLCRQWG
jgi:hypothetical protein